MIAHDQNRRFWAPYLLALATMVFVGLLWRGVSAPPPAFGQIPDSGAQRVQMIAELRTANKRLAEIAKLLGEIRDRQDAGGPSKDAQRTQAKRP
jgi:hypothetical protein